MGEGDTDRLCCVVLLNDFYPVSHNGRVWCTWPKRSPDRSITEWDVPFDCCSRGHLVFLFTVQLCYTLSSHSVLISAFASDSDLWACEYHWHLLRICPQVWLHCVSFQVCHFMNIWKEFCINVRLDLVSWSFRPKIQCCTLKLLAFALFVF